MIALLLCLSKATVTFLGRDSPGEKSTISNINHRLWFCLTSVPLGNFSLGKGDEKKDITWASDIG